MQNVTNWFLLGTYLKLEQPVLKKISADYGREGTERCKLEMIACWKRQDPAANWQKLKQALRSRNYDLAKSQTDGDDTYYTFEPLPYQQDQLGNYLVKTCETDPFISLHAGNNLIEKF